MSGIQIAQPEVNLCVFSSSPSFFSSPSSSSSASAVDASPSGSAVEFTVVLCLHCFTILDLSKELYIRINLKVLHDQHSWKKKIHPSVLSVTNLHTWNKVK